jgi:lysozyme
MSGRGVSFLAGLVAGWLGCALFAAEATEFPTEPDALTPGIFLDEDLSRALPPGQTPRAVSEKGISITKAAEGWRSRLYNDAASYCTIGYGHLIKKRSCDGSEPAEFMGGITVQTGEGLLRGDLENAEIAVMTMVTPTLTDGQYAALVDFVYNVGSGNFGKSSLLHIINGAPDGYGDIRIEFARWVKAGGRTLPGLQVRRARDADLFFEGISEPRGSSRTGQLPLIDIRSGE